MVMRNAWYVCYAVPGQRYWLIRGYLHGAVGVTCKLECIAAIYYARTNAVSTSMSSSKYTFKECQRWRPWMLALALGASAVSDDLKCGIGLE